MTDGDVVFRDTETTGLEHDSDIWEYYGVRRGADGSRTELHLHVMHDWAKVESMPREFQLDRVARFGQIVPTPLKVSMHRIWQFTDGAHVVGCVPNFDTERLALAMTRLGYRPLWHYHLIDVEVLAVGFLAALGKQVPLPWDSEKISEMLGVPVPGPGVRHTARGDVEWAMAIYDKVVGRQIKTDSRLSEAARSHG